jgi:hypothetical protein
MKGRRLLNLFGAVTVALLWMGANFGAAAEPVGVAAERMTTNSPYERIVLVGASATAGFTQSELLGGTNTPRYSLHRYMDAALIAPHEPVRNLGTSLFFFQAETTGRTQIEQALTTKPTLVVGIDFLFWYCYGRNSTEEQRIERFERGLKLLERVDCPLVLGDIPDASRAVGKVLSVEEVPSSRVITEVNRRLKDWAAKRPNVVIVSLADFLRTGLANEAFTVHGHLLEKGKTRMLIQGDTLHPTPPGAAVLAVVVLDAVQKLMKQPESLGDVVHWDPKEVFRLGYNGPQAMKENVKAAISTNSLPAESKRNGT